MQVLIKSNRLDATLATYGIQGCLVIKYNSCVAALNRFCSESVKHNHVFTVGTASPEEVSSPVTITIQRAYLFKRLAYTTLLRSVFFDSELDNRVHDANSHGSHAVPGTSAQSASLSSPAGTKREIISPKSLSTQPRFVSLWEEVEGQTQTPSPSRSSSPSHYPPPSRSPSPPSISVIRPLRARFAPEGWKPPNDYTPPSDRGIDWRPVKPLPPDRATHSRSKYAWYVAYKGIYKGVGIFKTW
jgi:hypothetical protein